MTTVATIVNGRRSTSTKDYQQIGPRLHHARRLPRVSADSKVTGSSVHFISEDKSAIKIGGVLNVVRHEVELHCPANDIPEFITVDLAGHKIGDSLHISHVKLPAGVTRSSPTATTIATIVAWRHR
jgi:large subunit ribosomal protein L25